VKLLVLDIETAPGIRYFWRLFDENGSIEQVIQPSRILCWAAKWVGVPGIHFRSEWGGGGTKGMLTQLSGLIWQADAVITQNGDRFDLPRINGALALAKLPPVPPVASIDIYKTIKQLGFDSNKLGYVGPLLGCGAKVKHEGFPLWTKVLAGDPNAQSRMMRYNLRDVQVTERVYQRLRPFIKNHPYCGEGGKVLECPACGGPKLQRRGFRRTKAFFIERLHCQSCGTWSDGKRTKATKGKP
jgi:hypothetical protein